MSSVITKERARFDRMVMVKIRKEITGREINVTQLAKEIGFSRNALYQNLEHKTSPSLFTVAKICKVLDLDANKLLGIRR